MTTYELAISIPKEKRKQLAEAGLLPPRVERDIHVYELFQSLLSEGRSKMDAYITVGQKCFTSEENLRKIIRKMSAEVR